MIMVMFIGLLLRSDYKSTHQNYDVDNVFFLKPPSSITFPIVTSHIPPPFIELTVSLAMIDKNLIIHYYYASLRCEAHNLKNDV